jgi:2',3'-cyclic-nucleotide 2'-phosphodiesterase (5'-nucleotidase family)
MKKLAWTLILGALVAVPAASFGAQIIADSVNEFSAAQGSNSWYYGYFNASAALHPSYDATNDFSRLRVFNGSTWIFDPSATYWLSISSLNATPNGGVNNGDRTPAEIWAIRRWVSTATGLVRIHGHVAANQTGGGDGIIVMIFVNGALKFMQSLAPADVIGFDYSFGVGLRTGDLVDFALTAGCCGNSTYDYTTFTGVVERSDLTLTTQTAVEVGVPTMRDQRYQMVHSLNLATWAVVGQPFTGTGDTMYFLFSTRELGSPGYFKAEEIP